MSLTPKKVLLIGACPSDFDTVAAWLPDCVVTGACNITEAIKVARECTLDVVICSEISQHVSLPAALEFARELQGAPVYVVPELNTQVQGSVTEYGSLKEVIAQKVAHVIATPTETGGISGTFVIEELQSIQAHIKKVAELAKSVPTR